MNNEERFQHFAANFWEQLKEQYTQLLYTLFTYPEAVRFTRKHKIWAGFWKYGWVSRFLVLLSALVGLKMVGSMTNWFRRVDTSDPLAAMSSVGQVFTSVLTEEYEYLTSGSMRYLMIILLEIVVFHVCRKSLQILTGRQSDASMKAFIEAQVRMIKVAFFCYFVEMVVGMVIKTGFNVMVPVDFLEPGFLFLNQLFFMGFAIMDNYLEQFHFSIKDSFKTSQQFIGVCLGTGLIVQVFFMVPLIGPVLAPFLAAVAVTLVLVELTDYHLELEPVAEDLQVEVEEDLV